MIELGGNHDRSLEELEEIASSPPCKHPTNKQTNRKTEAEEEKTAMYVQEDITKGGENNRRGQG